MWTTRLSWQRSKRTLWTDSKGTRRRSSAYAWTLANVSASSICLGLKGRTSVRRKKASDGFSPSQQRHREGGPLPDPPRHRVAFRGLIFFGQYVVHMDRLAIQNGAT